MKNKPTKLPDDVDIESHGPLPTTNDAAPRKNGPFRSPPTKKKQHNKAIPTRGRPSGVCRHDIWNESNHPTGRKIYTLPTLDISQATRQAPKNLL